MGDERPSFLQGHTWSLGVRLEIQYQQVTGIRIHNFKEEIRLIHAVCADPKMVGSKEQAGVGGLLAVHSECRVREGRALGCLLDHAGDSSGFRFLQVHLPVMMRKVDDLVRSRHFRTSTTL
jgi:hypothetical protein